LLPLLLPLWVVQAAALEDFGGFNKNAHRDISGPNVIAFLTQREHTLALIPGYHVEFASGVIVNIKLTATSAAVKPSQESLLVEITHCSSGSFSECCPPLEYSSVVLERGL
jgi:hypothetical protein